VSSPTRIHVTLLVAVALAVAGGGRAAAQTTRSTQLPALKQLSIEELLELDVTLPLRR
jgi:hypothetical protein